MQQHLADILPYGTDVSKVTLDDMNQFVNEFIPKLQTLMINRYPSRKDVIQKSYDFVRFDLSTERLETD